MGIDYVVIGFKMEVQPLVNAAWPFCSVRTYGVSAVHIDVMGSHMKSCRITYGNTR